MGTVEYSGQSSGKSGKLSVLYYCEAPSVIEGRICSGAEWLTSGFPAGRRLCCLSSGAWCEAVIWGAGTVGQERNICPSPAA